MALKAEAPVLDYLKVSLQCKAEKEKEKVAPESRLPSCAPARPFGPHAGPVDRVHAPPGERPVPKPAARIGPEEVSSSWSQDYLIAESSGQGRPVCMVCGGVLSASGPVAARKHILQYHAHSLDFSSEEKCNILEAWSEGAVLPKKEPKPSPAGDPSKSKQPAEIEVLLDSEEQPASRKRGHLKPRCEVMRLDPERRSQDQQRQHSLNSTKETKSPQQPLKTAGKEWLSECGVPGSAPAEIRIFTDGTFPAGFALKLYCRTQPEPAQKAEAKPSPRKRTVDRECSVSLLRLHSTSASQKLCPPQDRPPRALPNSPSSNAKDCDTKPRQQRAAGKEDAPLLVKGFNPSWRARFLMDFDAAAGQLVCMVCEYPLRRACLATVKRHILQCHAETLHLPREVRRTIREVWESRGQCPPQAPRK